MILMAAKRVTDAMEGWKECARSTVSVHVTERYEELLATNQEETPQSVDLGRASHHSIAVQVA